MATLLTLLALLTLLLKTYLEWRQQKDHESAQTEHPPIPEESSPTE